LPDVGLKVKEMPMLCISALLFRDRVTRTVLGSLLMWLSLWGLPLSMARADELKLETWRVEDVWVWENHLLPIFYQTPKSSPIEVSPSVPMDYDKLLLEGFEKGTAGDMVACRPFDRSFDLFEKGYLEDITHMPELRLFRNQGKFAWTSYYGERVFCMPVASVMTGFFYNTEIFKELKLEPPKTEEALFELLEKVQQSGKYLPLAFGTKHAWQAAQVLLAGMGPNHWGGEKGRLDLLTGRTKFSDGPFVEAWRSMAKMGDFLPPNHADVGEDEARDLFLSGRAAVYPAGSWEIRFLSNHRNHHLFGVFAPPPKSSSHNCYVLNHLDKGIGINAKSPQRAQAQAFLSWLSTPAFSNALANNLPGFFPLSTHPVEITNHLSKEMASWRQQCDSTIRINSQFLNQAWPALEEELWDTSVRVMRKDISPEQAAKHISSGVEKWFKPL
jgi:raffinose/stachyose/melibiose transport system substrate-binding protein